MKRDPDLCRAILLAVEEAEAFVTTDSIAEALGMDRSVVGFHAELLADAGLVIGEDFSSLDQPYGMQITRLTWEGCELLDLTRDEGRWAEAKEAAGEAKDWTFRTLAEVATAIAANAWAQYVSK